MENFFDNFGWIEIAFTYSIAFAFGFYQLWSVNREIAKDKAKKAETEAEKEALDGDASRHAVREHELDDR